MNARQCKEKIFKKPETGVAKNKKNAAINGTKREWYDSYVLKKKKVSATNNIFL